MEKPQSKAKLFEWMEDMKKFYDQIKARKQILKANDYDILKIISPCLNEKLPLKEGKSLKERERLQADQDI